MKKTDKLIIFKSYIRMISGNWTHILSVLPYYQWYCVYTMNPL